MRKLMYRLVGVALAAVGLATLITSQLRMAGADTRAATTLGAGVLICVLLAAGVVTLGRFLWLTGRRTGGTRE